MSAQIAFKSQIDVFELETLAEDVFQNLVRHARTIACKQNFQVGTAVADQLRSANSKKSLLLSALVGLSY